MTELERTRMIAELTKMPLKGFIEVHNAKNRNNLVLINIRHIVEVHDDIIYTDDTFPGATDYSYIRCAESYDEIKRKIKEAVGD